MEARAELRPLRAVFTTPPASAAVAKGARAAVKGCHPDRVACVHYSGNTTGEPYRPAETQRKLPECTEQSVERPRSPGQNDHGRVTGYRSTGTVWQTTPKQRVDI